MKRTLIYGTGSVQASNRRVERSPRADATHVWAPPARLWANPGANIGAISNVNAEPFTGGAGNEPPRVETLGAGQDNMQAAAQVAVTTRYPGHRKIDTAWREQIAVGILISAFKRVR